MIKPDFDITPADPASVEWMECRLVIEISRHHFHYVILDKKNQAVAMKVYRYRVNAVAELTGLLEEMVKDDGILQHKVKDYVIVYNWPESTFVPEAYFDINLNKDMLELTHGDVNKGIIFSENVHGWNLYNVYRIPTEIHEFFQHWFPGCTYWHHYSLWLKCRQQRNDKHDRVSILFYPDEMVISVIANGQLQLMQTAEYQTTDDIAWHVLNVFRQFNLPRNQMPVFLSGMIDPNAPAYHELATYFSVIVSDNMTSALTDADAGALPPDFFTPLLNLAPCVS